MSIFWCTGLNRGFAGLLALGVLWSSLAFGQTNISDERAMGAPGAVEAAPWQESLNSASTMASAGDIAGATRSLLEAIDLGFSSYGTLMFGASLQPIRDSTNWQSVLNAFDAKNAWAPSLRVLFDSARSPWERYSTGRAFLVTKKAVPKAELRTYRQLYATSATLVGQYDEADRYYGSVSTAAAPISAGYTRATNAIPELVDASRNARAIFLNESHGRSNTRAANLLIVQELAKKGFTHLALEAMSVEERSGSCGSVVAADSKLTERGYANKTTGYYINDPIYGELVRIAVKSGLKVVGYDYTFGRPTVALREEEQAKNIACILAEDGLARVIVIGGFAHISERDDHSVRGGLMGARFKRMTGIDPVTVDTTVLLTLDENALETRDATGPAGGPLLLKNKRHNRWAVDGYDYVVFVPSAKPRTDPEPHWLTLGGHREKYMVPAPPCASIGGCLLEARRIHESEDAVPVDRCVFRAGSPPCPLFLPVGSLRIERFSSGGIRIGDPIDVVIDQDRRNREGPEV